MKKKSQVPGPHSDWQITIRKRCTLLKKTFTNLSIGLGSAPRQDTDLQYMFHIHEIVEQFMV